MSISGLVVCFGQSISGLMDDYLRSNGLSISVLMVGFGLSISGQLVCLFEV